MIIKKIGGYLSTDKGGYIIPDVAQEKIQPHWHQLIERVVAFTEQQNDPNVLSLYIRGSVPRGLAVDGISDIDLVFVVQEKMTELSPEIRRFRKEVLQDFPFCCGIEWSIMSIGQVENTQQGLSKAAILLKTQALHIWGKDIAKNLPNITVGMHMVSHLPWFKKDWDDFMGDMKRVDTLQEIESCKKWMGKRLLRSAFELSMQEKPRFTRDLYWCYAGASEVYPAIEQELYAVLQMTLETNIPRQDIVAVFSPVAEFIIENLPE